jgi:sugar-specific transcriptional regulator TrmB
MEKRVIDTLKSIGLNNNEIAVYLDLLKAGKSSVINIAKRTGLHRSNTYDVLERLLEKGLVDESIEDDKKIFYPIDPSDLMDYLKQKEKELNEIVPELEKVQNLSDEERRITLSKGINSIKNILNHILDLKEPISTYGTSKKVQRL